MHGARTLWGRVRDGLKALAAGDHWVLQVGTDGTFSVCQVKDCKPAADPAALRFRSKAGAEWLKAKLEAKSNGRS